jgi:deazaflavin-dependent oxidoreductase (nitroreductase family)
VARHIQIYVRSGGTRGHRHAGRDALLLTTHGRKTGLPRRTALYYGRDGDRYVVVASNGGSPRQPQWYLNLLAHPRVEIQVGPEIIQADARPATANEKPRLWRLMAALFPPYDGMQERTKRPIPVVVIAPLASAAPDTPA